MSDGLLKPKHIKSKTVIGKSDGEDLILLQTFGGLQIVVKINKNDKVEILGSGSHAAIAKWQAEKKLKNQFKWNDE